MQKQLAFEDELSSSAVFTASDTSLSRPLACYTRKKNPHIVLVFMHMVKPTCESPDGAYDWKGYLLLEQCEASICCCCLFPLFLADRLEAALEVLLLLVQTLSPTLHILCNLTYKVLHCRLSYAYKHPMTTCSSKISSILERKKKIINMKATCWAVLLLGFSFFSLPSLAGVEELEAALL